MGFEVDPEHLRKHGGVIQDVGTGAAGDLNRLQQETTAGGAAPWGTDSAAATLGALYEELTSLTGEAVSLFTEGFQHSGSNVRRMADRYARMEEANSTRFDRIGESFGGQRA